MSKVGTQRTFRAPPLVSALENDLDAIEAIREDVVGSGGQEGVEADGGASSAPTPHQGQSPGEPTAQPAAPPWKAMFSTFGVNPDAPDDDDDETGRHRVRSNVGDVSPLGTYEDFVADGGWIPGETSMEVAIFRGDPESMRGHNDARFDVCFHVTGAPVDGDELLEKLRTEYGGGLFRLRFFEEKPGRTPFTSTKKSIVLSVEEDPIFKARLGKHLTHIEEKRIEANRTMQREKMEYGAQQQLISMLEQQRREYAEEARRLRDGGQGSDTQKMMFKMIEQQILDAREAAKQAREESKMTESNWLNLFNESARERDVVQERVMQTALSSQEKMFEAMTKGDDKMTPFLMMMMNQQKSEAEARREERLREEARRGEERDRERQAQLQQQQMFQMMMQQQGEQSRSQLQLMLALMTNDKKEDSFSKIAGVLAGSPVVAKLLERPHNQGNEMMQVLLPLMTNDKQNAEKRAAMLEDRMMQVLQSKNDPKQSMMELMQMMQLMQGLQGMMQPKVAEPTEDDKEEEEAATAIPAWMGAASDIAEKFGLGRVAEAFATSLINRGTAPSAPPATVPSETPRPPRVAPLASQGMPQHQIPIGMMPQMAQLPPAAPPQVASMQPAQDQGQPLQQPIPHPSPQGQAQPQGKQKMTPQEEQALFDNPAPEQANDIFNEIEKALTVSPMSPSDFAKSRSYAEKAVLRAILPKHLAVRFIRHHATDKPNIQTMEGLQWITEAVQHIYG